MKYVLIVSAVYPPEPVVSARLSADIYKKLHGMDIDVKVLHPHPTRPNGFEFEKNYFNGEYEIVTASYTCPQPSLFGRFKESLSFGKATNKYIREHHNEIEGIYANTWPLFAQYYLAKAAKKYNIPYYIHVQDIYPESYCFKLPRAIGWGLKRALLPMDKYVLRNATGVIGISPSMLSYLSESREVDKIKFTLVRNWQDDENYIVKYKPKENTSGVIKIMYLGSINPTANLPLIINACSCLDSSNFHLFIIGNGPDKDNCIALASRNGMDVTFDTVAPEEVAFKQGEADILVLCLKKGVAQTATPSKLTAYMLSGRPIVASVDEDSDCANIIREAKCGIVVEPDSVDSLHSAIIELSHKSLEELKAMGKSAFEYAIAHLSKERNLGVLIELLTRNR